jgi:hypothetical protein
VCCCCGPRNMAVIFVYVYLIDAFCPFDSSGLALTFLTVLVHGC